MKKSAVLALLLMLPVLALAAEYEMDKGAIEVGGTASFMSAGGDLYEIGDDGQTEFQISPMAHYFVIPNLGIGGTLSFSNWSQGDATQSTFGIGPSLQYYFGNAESRMYPFLGAAFMYTTSTYNDGTPGAEDLTVNGTTIEFLGGAALILADHFAVKGGLFYDIDSRKVDVEGAESVSGSVFGIQIGFSGYIY